MRGMYDALFRQMKKQLTQLEKWLDATRSFATEKKIDPDLFVDFRLAPDQFALGRQIQLAADTARLAAARLTGKEAPAQADGDRTLEQLGARVRATVEWLDGLTPGDLADAATRSVTQPRWEGKTMTGHDYFVEHALPNFYFHLAHAYAILRHNGVGLGKRDYLGALTQKPAPSSG
jgi:hypothetical protein